MGKRERSVPEIVAYDNGHIALWRSLLDSSLWVMRPEDRVLAIFLLLRANWRDREWFNKWQRKRVTVKRGELISSVESMATGSNLSVRNVRTSLKHLKTDGFIDLKNSENLTRQFHHIIICNYETYQIDNSQADKALPRDRQQLNKENNYNKRNRESERSRVPHPLPAQIELIRHVTGKTPPSALWESFTKVIGTATEDEIRPYFLAWIERGYKPVNYAWLTDWFATGMIPARNGGKGQQSERQKKYGKSADAIAEWLESKRREK